MTKAQQIAYLHAERLSVSEIALAIGKPQKYVQNFISSGLRWPSAANRDWQTKAFRSWRGYPISDKVVSL